MNTKDSYISKMCLRFEIFYNELSEKIMKVMESYYVITPILIMTLITLFVADFKILFTSHSTDHAFIMANNVFFFIFLIEFLIYILFEQNYNWSFYFYLDLLDIISLIPDTELIMVGVFGFEDPAETNAEIQPYFNVLKTSLSSQSAAK